MSFLMKVRQVLGGSAAVEMSGDKNGNAYIAQALPPYAVLCASGASVRVDCTTAVAAVAAIPTTTAMLTVWNGDATKSYIIDRLYAPQWEGNSTTMASIAIIYCLHPVGMVQPGAQDLTPKKLNGNGNYGGNAWCDVGHTVVNNGWVTAGGMTLGTHADDAVPGAAYVANIDGRVVLPPRAGLSMVVVTDRIATKVKCGMSWFEVDLDIA